MTDRFLIEFLLAMVVILFVGMIVIEHRVDKIERALRENGK